MPCCAGIEKSRAFQNERLDTWVTKCESSVLFWINSNKSYSGNISFSFTSIYYCHGNSIAPVARQRWIAAGWRLTRWIITKMLSFILTINDCLYKKSIKSCGSITNTVYSTIWFAFAAKLLPLCVKGINRHFFLRVRPVKVTVVKSGYVPLQLGP